MKLQGSVNVFMDSSSERKKKVANGIKQVVRRREVARGNYVLILMG